MALPEELVRELRLVVRREQTERRLPSVSAAVARDGEVAWTDAVGLADADRNEAARPETQYRIGSITKTFTAAAIMRLRDDGALALDDPLGEHVPESPHAGPTLRRMLAHASGLQREPAGEVWETLDALSRDALFARLGEAEQVLAPGEHWHYSNLAYILLGEVVARRSGLDYERFVEERFLRPLGLARTTWFAEPPAARGYFVEPYADAVRPEPDVDLAGGASAGQLWSTTGDLCRWAAFLADPDPAILARETVEEMHRLETMVDRERWTSAWGLGLALNRHGDVLLAGHTGGMPGHLSCVAYGRKERVAAAVLTNTSAGVDPHDIAAKLVLKTIEALPREPEPWRPQEEAPPEVAGVLGRWWSEGSETVFSYRRGRLEARAATDPPDAEPSVFVGEAPDRFRTVSGRERGEVLRLVRDDSGEVVKLYWATYPFLRVAAPFAEVKPGPPPTE